MLLSEHLFFFKFLGAHPSLPTFKPAPIMLEILPIILSRISLKFCPLFFCSLPISLIKFF